MITKEFSVANNEDWRDTVALSGAGTLVGATVLFQVKPHFAHPDAFLDMSSAVGGGLTVDTTNKIVSWAILAAEMGEVPPGEYEFDVMVIYASTAVKREATCTLTVLQGGTIVPRGTVVEVLGDVDGLES